MNMGRFFQRLALYRAARGVPTWVLVALALGFWALAAFDARAHYMGTDTKAVAYDKMQAHIVTWKNYCTNSIQPSRPDRFHVTLEYYEDNSHPAFMATYKCWLDGSTPTNVNHINTQQWHYNTACPTGEKYVRESDSCVDPAEQCLNKNDQISNPTSMVGAYGSCIAGCRIGQRTDDVKKTGSVEVAGAPAPLQFGSIGYTGETCSGNDPLPEFKDDTACTMVTGATAGNQTVCVRPDGRHCYAKDANNVTTFCWQPGEVGEQFADNVLQKREPGDKTQNPTPPTPPDGDALNQDGPSTKTTTTINNTTTTTTVTNYSTGSGASPRPGTGTGVPGDGSGDGTGTGDGDSNSVGGSGDCTAGWQSSGDAILGAILGELWQSRCAGEGEKGDRVSDAGSFGAAADAMEADPAGFFGAGNGPGAGIDEGWFTYGGTSCPSFPVVEIPGTGQTWTPPAALCEAIAALGLLFTLIAYVWALRIVGS